MSYLIKRIQLPILYFLLILFLESCYPQQREKLENLKESKIKISFVGDLMCHSAEIEAARVKADSFDFNPFYKFIKDELFAADLLIGNLETVVWEKYPPSGYPRFNAPKAFLTALKNSGFDILATANNHITDYWKEGLIQTLSNIKKSGMESIGCLLSEKEADSLKIFYKNGISIAILNYTYDINIKNLRKHDKFLVNIIDTNRIKTDILKIKNKNIDLIVVYYHFGNEYKNLPNNFQREIVKKTFAYGAKIIIGSHPHVLQPIETKKNYKGNLIESAVCYSLGNFLSNMKLKNTDEGAILNFYLHKSGEETVIDSIDFVPVWVYKNNVKKKIAILPSAGKFDFLNENEHLLIQQSRNNVINILNKFEHVDEKKIDQH